MPLPKDGWMLSVDFRVLHLVPVRADRVKFMYGMAYVGVWPAEPARGAPRARRSADVPGLH
jgi:hypothetical protein